MQHQFREQIADGVVPVLMSLLARMDNTVDGLRNVRVNRDGSLTFGPERNPSEFKDGVEITFHQGLGRRTLFYFRVDLGRALAPSGSFLKFLEARGHPQTLVKSASFLLHGKNFSTLREYLLANSTLILQDDTGVSFGYLDNGDWKITLFGEYHTPDPPFRREYQADLARYAGKERVKKLDFRWGYRLIAADQIYCWRCGSSPLTDRARDLRSPSHHANAKNQDSSDLLKTSICSRLSTSSLAIALVEQFPSLIQMTLGGWPNSRLRLRKSPSLLTTIKALLAA